MTGEIVGDVRALTGSINLIEAPTIGTSSAPVSIEAQDGVGRIRATGAVFADITTNAFSGDGGLSLFEAASYTGTLRTRTLEPVMGGLGSMLAEIDISGNFNGLISIDEEFMSDVTGTGGEIFIERISTGAGGLKGQIIINAENGGFNWSGGAQLRVGATFITSSEYTNLASALGGGSVGLAPFRLHDESSAPVNGTRQVNPGTIQSVKLRLYGPIEFNSQTVPARVFLRALDSNDSFVEFTDPLSTFTFAVDPSDDNSLVVTEKHTLGFGNDKEYKIIPNTNLKSSLVAGTPPVDQNWEYFLEQEAPGGGSGCQTCLCSTDPDCLMGGMLMGSGPDFNQNGVVDSNDLEWAIKAVGTIGGRFDINKDGLVDSADVAIVAEAVGSHPAK